MLFVEIEDEVVRSSESVAGAYAMHRSRRGRDAVRDTELSRNGNRTDAGGRS